MDNTVVTAIIAATAALSGVALSQASGMLKEHLNRAHQKKRLFREKYEQLADYISDGQVWLSDLLQSESLSQASLRTPIHARKAATLAAIYFPLLLEDAYNYLNTCSNLQPVILENHQFVAGVTAGAQAIHKNRQAVEIASDTFQRARQSLDEKIIKYADRYTHA